MQNDGEFLDEILLYTTIQVLLRVKTRQKRQTLLSSTRVHLVSRLRCLENSLGFFWDVRLSSLVYTVIPRLTSDPANEFFG